MLGVEMASPMDPLTEQIFWQCLTSAEPVGRIPLPEGPSTLYGGKAAGRLVGGNLSLIVSVLGTLYQPDFRDSILFVEDAGEEPYRVDRMLTQLKNSHALSRTRAILAGQFTNCVSKDSTASSISVEHILGDVAKTTGKPFLSNLPFGHVGRKLTLPVGLRVRVDAAAKTIEYLESAVR
jgi:muramoyltetrapeptide carboxypeptidase